MLEKLATHDVETVPTLFALADKCARAAVHGTRPHKPGLPRRVARVPSPGTVKRKRRATATRGRSLPRWSSQLRLGAGAITTNAHGRKGVTAARALYTPNDRHSAVECREIIDLAKRVSERVSERREQSSKDGSPPHRRPGKEKVDDDEVAAAE
jgi:hypothetical protein